MTRAAKLLAACLLFAGCTLLAPVPDRWRFFTLTALPPRALDAAPPANGWACGVGPISLPAYLERLEFATRVSPSEVAYSQMDRWAEPLSANVAAVLLQNLSSLLPATPVVGYPWQVGAKVDYQIEIGLRQFECGSDDQCALAGRWLIKDTRTGRFVVTRESSLSRSARASNGVAVAQALSDLLGELSEEIATALRALPAAARQ
jgi:uncharacterized protein